jgi:hypothetical protein
VSAIFWKQSAGYPGQVLEPNQRCATSDGCKHDQVPSFGCWPYRRPQPAAEHGLWGERRPRPADAPKRTAHRPPSSTGIHPGKLCRQNDIIKTNVPPVRRRRPLPPQTMEIAGRSFKGCDQTDASIDRCYQSAVCLPFGMRSLVNALPPYARNSVPSRGPLGRAAH